MILKGIFSWLEGREREETKRKRKKRDDKRMRGGILIVLPFDWMFKIIKNLRNFKIIEKHPSLTSARDKTKIVYISEGNPHPMN